MYTSVTNKISKKGFGYLVAAIVVAVSSAVYGLFSHGVHSPFMTYAFLVPLVLGAIPHIAAAQNNSAGMRDLRERLNDPVVGDVQLAVVATLTIGSLLKGALDIYGTTNRLLIGYPVMALMALVAAALIAKKGITKRPVYLLESPKDESGNYAYEDPGNDTAEQQHREIKEYTQFLDQGSCDE